MLLVAKPKLDILTLTDAFAVCLIQPLNGYVSGLAQKWFHKHPRKEMVKIKAHNTAICIAAWASMQWDRSPNYRCVALLHWIVTPLATHCSVIQ